MLSHNGLMFWSIRLIWGIADLGNRPALPSAVTVCRAGRYPVGPKHALYQAACAEIVLAAVPVATVPVEVVGVTVAQAVKAMTHPAPANIFQYFLIMCLMFMSYSCVGFTGGTIFPASGERFNMRTMW